MSSPDERARTVLIVDDEDAVRRVLEHALSAAGLNVLTADSGEEAVDVYRLNREVIDIVLLDVRMAPWDGPRVLSKLRDIDPTVRAAFMTGAPGTYTAEDLRAVGAERVFSKPFPSLTGLARDLRALVPAANPR